MEYRTHNNLTYSEIGLGCYGLSGAYGPVDVEAYQQVLVRGYELGVTFFDTAEAYGEAESILGDVLRPFRQNVLLATKVGARQGLDTRLTQDYVRTACERSLKNLGTDWIDLYQVHFDDPQTPPAEILAALEDLVQRGKIRHYGLGHLPRERLRTYLELGKPAAVLFELSAVSREALKTTLPLVRQASAAGLAFSITGRGLLTGAVQPNHTFPPGDIRHLDPLFQRARFESGLRIAARLAEIGKKYHRTPVQMAIAWVLAQPGITCALTGPSTLTHLEENLASSGWKFPSAEQQAFEDFLSGENTELVLAQLETLARILRQPLAQDPQAAFKDLVYAFETAIQLDLTTETQVMPLFRELFALRKNLDENVRPKMRQIQQKFEQDISIPPGLES